jgi:hypothetical protein
METDPSIERLGALFAASARCDTDGVRRALDHVPEADLVFDQKPRQPDAVRFARLRLAGVRLNHFSSMLHTKMRGQVTTLQKNAAKKPYAEGKRSWKDAVR